MSDALTLTVVPVLGAPWTFTGSPDEVADRGSALSDDRKVRDAYVDEDGERFWFRRSGRWACDITRAPR